MSKYTTEDLIQYLYQETSQEENRAIEKAMETDWDLHEDYEALKESKQGLDGISMSPRSQTIMAILNYAKASASAEVEH